MENHRSSGQPSLGSRVHALVERYTPDGGLGRSLLGTMTGAVGLYLLALVVFEIPRWGLSLAALFWTPVLLGFGLPALLLSIVVLWPLYLSLIGNLEAADEYAVSGPAEPSKPNATEPASVDEFDDSLERDDVDPSDPFADLKRRYANGELSEDEFERRLEARLADGAARSTGHGSARDDGSERRRETVTDGRG